MSLRLPYGALAVTRGPIAYYRLGEPGTLIDSSGHQRDGVSGFGTTTPGLLTGDDDTALTDPTGTVASADQWAASLPGLTLSCWMRTSSSNLQALVGRSNAQDFGSAVNHAFRMFISGGQITLQVFDGSGNPIFTLSGGAGLNDGQRHYVAATWQPSAFARIYVDGTQVAQVATPSTAMGAATTRPLCIGWMDHPVEGNWFRFSGVLDEVEVYDRPLSADEVQQAHTTGTTVPAFPPQQVEAAPEVDAVSLAWDPPTSGGAPDAYEYRLDDEAPRTTTSLSARMSGLTPATEYLAQVRTLTSDGFSAWSEQAFLTDPPTLYPHFYRTVRDPQGVLVPVAVSLLLPGTDTPYPGEVYSDASGTRRAGPQWFSTRGVVDFYLTQGAVLDIALEPLNGDDPMRWENQWVGPGPGGGTPVGDIGRPVVVLTESQYFALDPVDPDTLYLIREEIL